MRSRAGALSWGGVLLGLCCCASPAPVPSRGPPIAPAPAEAPAAEGQGGIRQVLLDYQAAPPCQDPDSYVGHVEDRSGRLHLEPDRLTSTTSERARVRVAPDPAGVGWLGQLHITGWAELDREVRGARCEDVVAALALITVLRYEGLDNPASTEPGSPSLAEGGDTDAAVLTLGSPGLAEGAKPEAGGVTIPTRPDPPPPTSNADERTASGPSSSGDDGATSREEGNGEGAASQEEPPAEPALGSPGDRGPAASEETAALAPPSTETNNTSELPSDSTRGTADATYQSADSSDASVSAASGFAAVEASVLAYVGYAAVPSNAIKALLRAELRLDETLTSWSAGLSVAYARGNDTGSDGTAALTLLTAELQLCPPGVSLDATFWLQGCADVRGGRVILSFTPGDRPLLTEDAFRPWAAVGPSLQAGARLSDEWALRAVAAFSLHLIRDKFEIARRAPNEDDPPLRFTLYQPRAMSIELLLGVGYSF